MTSLKPKVAIITPGTFPIPSPRSSSVEIVVDKVSRILSEEVHFYIFGKKTRNFSACETQAGVTYVRPSFGKQAAYLKKVKQWIKKVRPDFIQVENRPRFVKYLRRTFPRVPIWISLHSITFISEPHIHVKQLANCLRCANKVIVNSHFLKDYLVALLPWAEDRVLVNHLGVDTEQFAPRWLEEQQMLRQQFIDAIGYQNKKIILYVGRLLDLKGVHYLLETMPSVIARYPDAILVIAGSAYYGSDRLTPYVCELHQMGNKMPRNVRFIPFVPHNYIQEWFRAADIVAVPSSEHEAFGLVNLEAMATGVPVIATNAGGLKEIVDHGNTGFLIDPNDMKSQLSGRIIDLLGDEELAKRMGEAGVCRVQDHFTWQRTAERLLNFYRSHF